jgi:hypothetical protein
MEASEQIEQIRKNGVGFTHCDGCCRIWVRGKMADGGRAVHVILMPIPVER